MAKQRLVDFRGGINEKVSPHMIGDSQGQDAEDLDFATVRLEGRKNFNSANKANGSFLYDPGDGTANARWVSIYPSDTNSYIEYASDFAVWNRDLYVAMGAKVKYDSNDNLVLVASTDHSGQTIRYLDGGTTAQTLTFNPPSAAAVTLTDPSWNTAIVPAIDEFDPPPPAGETGIVTTGASDTTSWTYINYTEWSGLYTQYGTEEASAGGRTIYRKSGSSTNYYIGGTSSNPETSSSYQVAGLGDPFTGETSGYFYTRSNDSIVTTNNVGVTTSNRNDFGVQSDGSWDRNGVFLTFGNIHGQDSSGNDYYTWYRYGAGVSNLYGRHTSVANSPIYQGTPTTGTTTLYEPSQSGTLNLTTATEISWGWFRDTATFYGYVTDKTTGLASNEQNWNTLNTTYSHYDHSSWISTTDLFESWIPSSFDSSKFTLQSSNVNIDNNDFNVYQFNQYTTYYAWQSGTLNLVQGRFYTRSGSSGNYTYTALWFQGWPDSGYVEIYYNGTLKYTNVGSSTSYANAPRSVTITENGVSYTYRGVPNTSSGFNGGQWGGNVYTFNYILFPLRREYQGTYYNYTSLPQLTQTKFSFPANMTYTVHQDTVPAGTTIPATDAFVYDDARVEIYQPNTASGTPTVINDESRGDSWLDNGRAFSGPDGASAYGYFLKSVRESNGLPTLSTNDVRATLANSGSYTVDTISATNALHTPQRMNFDITAPTDQQTNPDAYRLYRKDNDGVTGLGYIRPSRLNVSGSADNIFGGDYTADISISFNSSNNTVTISNLLASKDYRLKWWCYQQTTLTSATNSSSTVDTSLAARSNTIGYAFTGTTSLTLQLATITNGDSRMYAIDIWLEESFLDGASTSTLLDDTYAIVKCYDLLHDTAYDNIDADHDGTGDDVAQTVQGTSDFLDLFSSDLLSEGLSSSSNSVSAPKYCKFFKESNNFFFAVGTEFTDASSYTNSGSTNKKGSYLFVSEYNDPTQWFSTGYVQFNSEITGLHTYPGELVVWTENGTFRVAGSRYDQMRKTKLATTEGLPEGNHRTITLVNNYLVWVSSTGICFYDGRQVTNLTRGRFNNFGFSENQKRSIYDYSDTNTELPGTGLHAGQKDGIYYVLGVDEQGFAVDFNLPGFPITRVNLREDGVDNTNSEIPVFVYNPRDNRLMTRKGSVAEGDGYNNWTYKTRDFDGGAFGTLKLVKSVVLNGTGSGKVQIYLDGSPIFSDNNSTGKTVSIDYSATSSNQPAKIYLPASVNGSTYGLPIADVWSVELVNWNGKVDWIDTEYELVSD